MEAKHPDELVRISCEYCGTRCKPEDSVSREDDSGNEFALCADCGGDYRKVMVVQDGNDWVVKKMNYHEIDRFRSRSKARKHAENVAFMVE